MVNELRNSKNLFRFFIVAGYTICMTLISWWNNGRSCFGSDDANIYLSYMRNFAMGHGFVYNVGGEKVEGFTSLLWTILGSIFYHFVNYPEYLLLCVNVLIITITLTRLIFFIESVFGSDRLLSNQSYLLLFLLLIIPGYFDWTIMSLMETGLWSFVLVMAVINIISQSKSKWGQRINLVEFAILLVIMILCRPESMLWSGFLILSKHLFLHLTGSKLSRKKTLTVLYAGIAGLTLTILTSWRLYYFGFPFPNTYYAKISADRIENFFQGIDYDLYFIEQNPIAALVLVFSIWAIIKMLKNYSPKENLPSKTIQQFILSAVVLTSLLVPIITGGDHFYGHRFIQPVVPIYYLALLFFIENLNIRLSSALVLAFIGFVILSMDSNVVVQISRVYSPIRPEFEIAKKGRYRSERFNEFFKELNTKPTQGVYATGGAGYSYHGITNDLLGLNNVEMAHANSVKIGMKNHGSFNKDVFFEQKPDLLSFSSVFLPNSTQSQLPVIKVHPVFQRGFQNVFEDVRFSENYEAVVLTRTDYPDALLIFASKLFLNEVLIDTQYFYKKATWCYSYRDIAVCSFEQ